MPNSPGKENKKHEEWLITETWAHITKRKQLKDKINQTQGQENKLVLQACYWNKNREMKRGARKDEKFH